jgi:hypothetical protein
MGPRRPFTPGFGRETSGGRANNARYYREETDAPSYLAGKEEQENRISKSLEEWRRKRKENTGNQRERREERAGTETREKEKEEKEYDLGEIYDDYYDDIADQHVTRTSHDSIRKEGKNKKAAVIQISPFGSSSPFTSPTTSDSSNNPPLTRLQAKNYKTCKTDHETRKTSHETPLTNSTPHPDLKTTPPLTNNTTQPDPKTLTPPQETRSRITTETNRDNEPDAKEERPKIKKEATQGNLGELNDRTTALCCSAQVRGAPITLIVDTGASGSVAGKQFLDDH